MGVLATSLICHSESPGTTGFLGLPVDAGASGR